MQNSVHNENSLENNNVEKKQKNFFLRYFKQLLSIVLIVIAIIGVLDTSSFIISVGTGIGSGQKVTSFKELNPLKVSLIFIDSSIALSGLYFYCLFIHPDADTEASFFCFTQSSRINESAFASDGDNIPLTGLCGGLSRDSRVYEHKLSRKQLRALRS